MDGYVYHIPKPGFENDLNEGYIGVTNAEKGVLTRFREHSKKKSYMRPHIRENKIKAEDVKIIFSGTMDDCYAKEKVLRPKENIGWNVASGGKGYNYRRKTDDLKKFRSEFQTKRMQDAELKKKQSDSFKATYYADQQAIELRQKRAREHMADPEKRAKCLTAMHKKKKCPHCDYENNGGNLAIHIRKKH